MLPQDKLGYELRRPLRRNVLQDVNLLVQPLTSLRIPLVAEISLLPPEGVLAYEAATAAAKDPCQFVLKESVVELAALNDSAFQGLIRLLAVFYRGLVFVALWGRWVHATDERVEELEIFVWGNNHGQEAPNDRGEATNKTQDQVQGVDRPLYLVLLPGLNELTNEKRIFVIIVLKFAS